MDWYGTFMNILASWERLSVIDITNMSVLNMANFVGPCIIHLYRMCDAESRSRSGSGNGFSSRLRFDLKFSERHHVVSYLFSFLFVQIFAVDPMLTSSSIFAAEITCLLISSDSAPFLRVCFEAHNVDTSIIKNIPSPQSPGRSNFFPDFFVENPQCLDDGQGPLRGCLHTKRWRWMLQ